MTPEEEQELAELEELERLEAEVGGASPRPPAPARATQPPDPDQAKADELAPLLSPAMPIAPQVLATQPATTHPGGDEAAQADWVVKGTDSAKGATVVYEPPLAKARKELLENPQLLAALYPDEPITREEIAAMDESSDIYKTYADHKWNEVRWAAADSGATAYRHAKMPWLQGGAAGLSPLHTIVTKVRGSIDPAIEGANAFIMGMDDTATFGAAKKAGEAIDRNVGAGPSPETPVADAIRGASATGGVSGEANAGASPEAVNEMLAEENPKLHTAGQIAGMFTPGGVMGLLGKAGAKVVAGAGRAAEALGAGTKLAGAAKLGGAGAAAAGGGAAASAGRDIVEAGANLAQTGETGTTPGEVAGRAAEAALDPMNLALGVGGEAAGMAARAGAKAIADSPRYGGNIDRIKQLGGKFVFGKGPMGTKETDAAIAAGKARDITPVAVMAEELAPKIAAAENELAAGNLVGAKAKKDALKQEHAKFKEGYFKSKEGEQALPPVATMETNLKHLRSKMTPEPGGGLRPVGNAEGVATARAEFSGDVAKVSLEPAKGAIELTPDEAEMFLSPALTHDLVPKPKAPPPAPPATGAREIDLGGPGAAPDLAATPPAGVNKQGVNVIKPTPTKSVTGAPEGATPVDDLEGFATVPPEPGPREARTAPVPGGPEVRSGTQAALEQEPLREARAAMQRDAKRAEALAKEFGSEANVQRLKDERGALYPEEVRGPTPKAAPEEQWRVNAREQAAARAPKKSEDGLTKEVAQKLVGGTTGAEFDTVASDLKKHGFKVTPNNVRKRNAIGGADRMGKPDAHGNASGKSGLEQQVNDEYLPFLDREIQGYGADVASKGSSLAEAIKSTTNEKSGMSTVSGVVKAMGGDRKAAHKALLEAEQKGAIELRPEGALKGRFSEVEEADMIAGPTKGMKLNPIRVIDEKLLGSILVGSGATAAGAATGDEGAAAGASTVGLALALKKRGVRKVYVVPRRYNAQQHEVRIGQLKDLTKDPKMPGAREAKERYAAALQDRGQRTLGGKPGGWSEKQQTISEQLTALEENLALAEKAAKTKGAAKRDAPGGTANQRLVRYANQRNNELPLKKEIEEAGARAGVLPQLQNLRLLDPLEQLRGTMSYRGKTAPRSKSGLIGAAADMAALRFAYPGLDAAGSLRGGSMSGVALQQLIQDEKKEAR